MKTLSLILFSVILILTITNSSCKKSNSNVDYDVCDTRRPTVIAAKNWTGYLSYYNDLKKWAVNVYIPGTIDGLRTCIVCTDIPDDLKNPGQVVTFSGDLKASNGVPVANLGGQEIYYVTPTILNR